MHRYKVPASNPAEEEVKLDSIDVMATVGHEIRNSLNAIIGLSHLLNSTTSLQEVKNYTEGLLQTSENLLEIGNNLMDFSKLRSGSLKMNLKPVKLQASLARQLSGQRMVAEAKGLCFFIDYDDAIPATVLLDSVKVGQVVLNLVSNAIKFTAAGHVGVTVELLNKTESEVHLLFTVEDTGIGISKNNLETIFKPFDQGDGDTNLHFGGTGLGLTICLKLVEILGTSLVVESELGKGSKFRFVLTAPIGMKEDIEIPSLATGKSVKGLRILVVEDSSLNRLIVQKYLESMEIVCTTACNGIKALEVIEGQDFDLIFTDLRMPQMNGYELVKNLRNRGDQKFRDVPVIALTGSLDGQCQEDFRKDGFSGYLLKPFKPEDLLNVILKDRNKVPVHTERSDNLKGFPPFTLHRAAVGNW